MNGHGVLTLSCHKEIAYAEREGILGPIDPGEYAVLSVTDTGAGISADDIHKIFVPSYSSKEEGTGISTQRALDLRTTATTSLLMSPAASKTI